MERVFHSAYNGREISNNSPDGRGLRSYANWRGYGKCHTHLAGPKAGQKREGLFAGAFQPFAEGGLRDTQKLCRQTLIVAGAFQGLINQHLR